MIMNPVPHLTTAQSGPLFPVEAAMVNEIINIESWFRQSWALTPAPLMSSVDLRHAGFKLAPIDTNLFPGGFNNLNPDFMPLCVQALQSTLGNNCQRLLLLGENHTRNTFYLKSLAVLRDILLKAGYSVRLGNLDQTLADIVELSVEDHEPLRLEPLIRTGARIGLKQYDPCLVILNNDLSAGVPDILQNLNQRIEPATQLGWSSRLKSNHFHYYNEVVQAFSKVIHIDPWMINPLFSAVDDIDFMAKIGIDRLSEAVDSLLLQIKAQYRLFGITEKPYVVIKADNGTYGMGVMMVHDASEVLALNRKQRTKMATTKGSQTVRRVMIQEGVYSFETMTDGAVAEPVVYMMGQFVVGGFYRVHRELGTNDILNTPGMHFEPLAFAQACNIPSRCNNVVDDPNRFYAYGVIARLAALAAARESAALRKSE